MPPPFVSGSEQTCRICGQPGTRLFEAPVLGRFTARYYRCARCGFVQVGNPGWLGEAYRETITREDTMIVERNINARRNLVILFSRLLSFAPADRFLDYAGGTGLLVRLMRDAGYDFHWQDPFTPNVFARGFEAQAGTAYTAVTCIEGLEHFAAPLDELARMFSLADTLLCTTCLLPREPLTPDWPYLGRGHGQHISLFAPETLAWVGARFGARYHEALGIHILTRRPLSPRRLAALRLACRSRFLYGALYYQARRRSGTRAYSDSDRLAGRAPALPGETTEASPG